MKSNKIYYDPTPVLSYGAMLNYVIGARGTGKTYGWKKWCVLHFLKTGKKFIYLRRYKTELKDIDQFFDTLCSDPELQDHELAVKGRRFYVDGRMCGKAVELSVSQAKKSVDEPEVDTILFDEFIIETGNIYYIKDEVNKLLAYMDSVFRNRSNCRCVCLGNSIKWNNAHFLYWKFKYRDSVNYIATFKKGTILLQIYNNESFTEMRSKLKFSDLVKDTLYADMAFHNRFRDVSNDYVEKRPRDSSLEFNIKWGEDTFGVWSDDDYRSKLYVSKAHNDEVITMFYSLGDLTDNKLLIYGHSTYNTKVLKDAFSYGYLYYESLYIRDRMMDLLNRIGIRR